MQIIKILLIIALTAGLLSAGDNQTPGNWLSIQWDNDVVFQTDRYYTNGLKMEYFNSGLNHSFADYIHPGHNDQDKVFYSFSVQQDIFTPRDKSSLTSQALDRPFASYLLFGSRKTIINAHRNLITQSELQLGLLGKYSGGEWLQNGIHSALPTSREFAGWENQIRSDILINYGLRLEKQLSGSNWYNISASAEGKIGLPYTFAGMGIHLRLGSVRQYFDFLHLYVSRDIESFVYTSLNGRYLAYNATIQGGLLNRPEENHLEINNFIYDLDNGIHLAYHSVKVNLGIKMLSPDFKNGSLHRWGYISFLFSL